MHTNSFGSYDLKFVVFPWNWKNECYDHQKKMKDGERLLQTFECNVNYPVGWMGPVVARRKEEEIIKILAQTDTVMLPKSKPCIYKAKECTFSCRRTSHLGGEAAKCGSARFQPQRCVLHGIMWTFPAWSVFSAWKPVRLVGSLNCDWTGLISAVIKLHLITLNLKVQG